MPPAKLTGLRGGTTQTDELFEFACWFSDEKAHLSESTANICVRKFDLEIAITIALPLSLAIYVD